MIEFLPKPLGHTVPITIIGAYNSSSAKIISILFLERKFYLEKVWKQLELNSGPLDFEQALLTTQPLTSPLNHLIPIMSSI